MTAIVEAPSFAAVNDRCDRCNATGKLRVRLVSGGELVFCGHHANRFATDLVKVVARYAADPEFTWRGVSLMRSRVPA